MAKKKLTARGRDIERLTKDYQSSLTALSPEYESVFQKKAETVSGYEQQSKDFQKRLEDYQKSLAAYKANPFEADKIRGKFRYETLSKAGSADPYEWGYVIDGQWRSAKALPEGYVEESDTGEFALKRKSIPKFTEAPPQVADVSQSDADLEQVQAKRKTLGEGFEREIAERKAGRVAAVSRRAQARPMLSKEVAL